MLPLSEPCLAMETISCFSNHRKSKQTTLVLLLRSGSLCLYDDSEIEHYLSQCQSKSSPTLPKQLTVKLPYGDSAISAAKLYKGASNLIYEVGFYFLPFFPNRSCLFNTPSYLFVGISICISCIGPSIPCQQTLLSLLNEHEGKRWKFSEFCTS